jgi:hypothetical protein
MANLIQDLRFAFRLLVRHPAVTIVAIVSLALGVGANTTVFTLVNAILLNPMPVKHISRLVTVGYQRDQERRARATQRGVASQLRGSSVTATATDPLGNSSECSACVTVPLS